MAKDVYILGAGFNCSILDPTTTNMEAPLARNFFQVLIKAYSDRKIDFIRQNLPLDALLEEIHRYWKLDTDALATTPFDIEECLTLFESLLDDQQPPDRATALRHAAFALRHLLLAYLTDLIPDLTPPSRRFAHDVLTTHADILTFNYDTLAETALEAASGPGPKPQPANQPRQPPQSLQELLAPRQLSDDDLDASHSAWNSNLAYSVRFAEVSLPVAGLPYYISGERYYSHPSNTLYSHSRVLKLHGSTDWLTYNRPAGLPLPPEIQPLVQQPPPEGIVLERHSHYWLGKPPEHGDWYMEPVIIPPQLYKRFDQPPFSDIWEAALTSLTECETLIVIGYSFPPTDFRTRRLFLEAFSDHSPRHLTVVNPAAEVTDTIRKLTHYNGPVTICNDLRSLYGLPSA